MTYWLDLFTPDTWSRFLQHGSLVSGFPQSMRTHAAQVAVGDIFLCYMVRISRFCGALRVASAAYQDASPIFAEANDPYTVRFKVEVLASLQPEIAIPVTSEEVWERLTWTKGRENGYRWGILFRRSLRPFPTEDGEFLLARLLEQVARPRAYVLADAEKNPLKRDR